MPSAPAVGAVGLLLGLCWLGAPVSAHVTITPSTTAAGASAVVQVAFQHGCDGSPTTQLTIRIPEGVNTVAPTLVPGWQVDRQVEALDPPVADGHGVELTERVASVTYVADEPVPDGFRQVFELAVQLPEAVGETLAFPAIQTCEAGEAAWIEVGEEGQELEHPAPTMTTTADVDEAEHEHEHDNAAADGGAGAGVADGSPAPASAEDGSDTVLGLVGVGAGVLGAVLGGAALVLQRRRA